MDQGKQAASFIRAYEGAMEFGASLRSVLTDIEAMTDYLRLQRSLTASAAQLNRQLFTVMEEVNELEKLVTDAERKMEMNVPMVEDADTPDEVLEAEGVFRQDWMCYGAVVMSDE